MIYGSVGTSLHTNKNWPIKKKWSRIKCSRLTCTLVLKQILPSLHTTMGLVVPGAFISKTPGSVPSVRITRLKIIESVYIVFNELIELF